jgi:hypothetical protein
MKHLRTLMQNSDKYEQHSTMGTVQPQPLSLIQDLTLNLSDPKPITSMINNFHLRFFFHISVQIQGSQKKP